VRTGLYRLEVNIEGEAVRTIPIPVVQTPAHGQVTTEREWPNQIELPARVKRAAPRKNAKRRR
jgi:hypothetical protein